MLEKYENCLKAINVKGRSQMSPKSNQLWDTNTLNEQQALLLQKNRATR